MQGGLPPLLGAATLAHAVEHEQGVVHHHDDNGSIHYDDADASLAHAHEHSSCLQLAGLALFLPALMPAPALSEPVAYIARTIPEPFLDGPQRPPAPSLGLAAGGMSHA